MKLVPTTVNDVKSEGPVICPQFLEIVQSWFPNEPAPRLEEIEEIILILYKLKVLELESEVFL